MKYTCFDNFEIDIFGVLEKHSLPSLTFWISLSRNLDISSKEKKIVWKKTATDFNNTEIWKKHVHVQLRK